MGFELRKDGERLCLVIPITEATVHDKVNERTGAVTKTRVSLVSVQEGGMGQSATVKGVPASMRAVYVRATLSMDATEEAGAWIAKLGLPVGVRATEPKEAKSAAPSTIKAADFAASRKPGPVKVRKMTPTEAAQ